MMMADPMRGLLSTPQAQANSYRFMVGEIECIALSDGAIPVPREMMEGKRPGGAPTQPGPPDLVLVPLACLLVRLPAHGRLVLIDTGFGPVPERGGAPLPTAGRLGESMSSVGISAEDIGDVLISHIHPDHTDGLFNNDGSKVYENATYRVGADEFAFWGKPGLDLAEFPTPPPLKRGMLAGAARLMKFGADRLVTFRTGEEILPGITSIKLDGHSPAQCGFVIESKGERLLYTADALSNLKSLQDDPGAPDIFDMNPDQAAKTRLAVLKMLADPVWRGFTPHFPFPAVGRVRRTDDGFTWRPDA